MDKVQNKTKNVTEYGFAEEHLSKEEMSDLLKALRNSKTTNLLEDETREKQNVILLFYLSINH